MKILLLGDYSGCHAVLAEGLRLEGHEVDVASAGSGWQNTPRDIDISRHLKNKIGGALLWHRLNRLAEKEFTGYDVVSINNPICFDLRPERNMALLDKIFRRNRSVFLTAMGTDYYHILECLNPNSPIKYNEWRVSDKPSPLALAKDNDLSLWQARELADECSEVYSRIHGAQAVLYEYFISLSRVLPEYKRSYCGIPVKSTGERHTFSKGPVKVLLGRHRGREIEKGTLILEECMRKAMTHLPSGSVEFKIIENLPWRDYRREQASADIILDQIYSYTPATNALWAMSRGQLAVTGADDAYYNFIGEDRLRPAFDASPYPEILLPQLTDLLRDKEKMRDTASQGPEFVIKHNDYVIVAKRCLDFWNSRIKAEGL